MEGRSVPVTPAGTVNADTVTPSASSSRPLTAPTISRADLHADPVVALEQVLADRNNLSQQNAQLWRLVERQKGFAASIQKDLDRIKAERDRLRAREKASLLQHRAVLNSTNNNINNNNTANNPTSPNFPGTSISISHSKSDSSASAATSLGQFEVQAPNMLGVAQKVSKRHSSVLDFPPETRQYFANLPPSPTEALSSSREREPLSKPPVERTSAAKSDDDKSGHHIAHQVASEMDHNQEFKSTVKRTSSESEGSGGRPKYHRQFSDPIPLKMNNLAVDSAPAFPSSTLSQPVALPISPESDSPTLSVSMPHLPDVAGGQESSPQIIFIPSPNHGIPSLPSPSSMTTPSLSSPVSTSKSLSIIPTSEAVIIPTLTARQLPYVSVRVPTSRITSNHKGKEVINFLITVTLSSPLSPTTSTWRVKKLFSQFLSLDSELKALLKDKKSTGKLKDLPDARLFKDHAPNKVDMRKEKLETYLCHLIGPQIALSDIGVVCRFLTEDIVEEEPEAVWDEVRREHGYKEGYLTRTGQKFHAWKTRFFVIQGPILTYYDQKGGALLGTMVVSGAVVGTQRADADISSERALRHALFLQERRDNKGRDLQPKFYTVHKLCADNDQERDIWTEVLHRWSKVEINESTVISVDQGAQKASTSQSASSSNSTMLLRKPTKPTVKLDISQSDSISKASHDIINPRVNSPVINTRDASIQGAWDIEKSTKPSNDQIYASPSMPALSSFSPPMNVLNSSSQSKIDPSSPPMQSNISQDDFSLQIHTKSRASVVPPSEASKIAISGPMNGIPIPSGYNFGAKDPDALSSHGSQGNGGVSNPHGPGSISENIKTKSHGRFWGFGSSNKNIPEAKPVIGSRPVFGVPLARSLAIAEKHNIPAVVFRCIEYLETKHAEGEEGIYRLNGSSAVIKALRERFNNEGDVNLLGSGEYYDFNAITGLLKSWLRDLPSSMLTHDMHMAFTSVVDLVRREDQVRELNSLVSRLPQANYNLLRFLMVHLKHIVDNSDVNKMNLRNVSIVLSPTLGISATLFTLFLEEYHAIFCDPGDSALVELEPKAIVNEEEAETESQNTEEQSALTPRPRQSIETERRGAFNRNSVAFESGGLQRVVAGVNTRPRLERNQNSGSLSGSTYDNDINEEDTTDDSKSFNTSDKSMGTYSSSYERIQDYPVPTAQTMPHKDLMLAPTTPLNFGRSSNSSSPRSPAFSTVPNILPGQPTSPITTTSNHTSQAGTQNSTAANTF